jgi:hypothetical protein
MAALEEKDGGYDQEAHQVKFCYPHRLNSGVYFDGSTQVAYIFVGRDEETRLQRAPKRRRVSKKQALKDKAEGMDKASSSFFVPLLNGAESRECVELRERLYRRSWEKIHGRVQVRPITPACTRLQTKNSATTGD